MTERSLVKNAADPKQVKQAKEKENFSKQRERNDLAWVLSNVKGRRFVWKLMKKANELSFVPNAPDLTAFNEGARNEANRLFVEVASNFPDAYLLMTREANAESEEMNGTTETENKNDK